ncbi:polysaccharide biosynthesis/export family protein [Pseudomonas fluorescens]|nr:polysaccharide biosynthesis/export family protein [Pseudomonas fluorescens]
MIRSLSIAVLAGIALQGCVFSPGQEMDTGSIIGDESSENSRVELIPITPKLVAIDAATETRNSIPQELLSFKPSDYRIGANDVLYITVWDHPELTAPSGAQQQIDANGRLVRPDGTLFYPYIGSVKAAGKTIEELRATLAEHLAQYVESPQVDVNIIRFASQKVMISGAVQKAGPQPITTTPMNIVEALGAAGVDVNMADLSGLTLTRDGHTNTLDFDSLNRSETDLYKVYLKGGDQLHLPYNDRKKVYIVGEVNTPRFINFKTNKINLADALGTAGGLRQETARGNSVYVIRATKDLETRPAQVFQLEAQSPTAYAVASQFYLQPQDVVFVGPAKITRWNRFITQLLPSSGLVSSGVTTQNNLRDN